MKSHGIEDDLKIQNNVNPDNSKSLKLNIVDNIGGGIGTSSNTDVHNIDVDEANETNVVYMTHQLILCFRYVSF
ncbi:hypothetical protein IMY05_C2303000100 [Salix suchowensis]|nr:hypothetical protein IMY05_C2303000100 [Salix suchowensis]